MLLRSCGVAERAASRGARLVTIHAFVNEAVHLEREMRLDFLAKVFVAPTLAPKCHRHGSASPFGLRVQHPHDG
jgi:hypothetical protein